MPELTIVTNNVPRNLIYGYELSDKEKADFDYIEADELETHNFFRYKGQVYDPSEFCLIYAGEHNPSYHPGIMQVDEANPFAQWEGYHGQTYFSGIVIRYTNDNEQVIVGRYYS